jgi:hypothetical protein
MGRECECPEKIRKGGIAHIQSACECTEGRHDHPRVVRSKTSTAHRAATM